LALRRRCSSFKRDILAPRASPQRQISSSAPVPIYETGSTCGSLGASLYQRSQLKGRFRSGQTGQTVNLLALRLRWFESSPAHFASDYRRRFFVAVCFFALLRAADDFRAFARLFVFLAPPDFPASFFLDFAPRFLPAVAFREREEVFFVG
jgi:hypothetical protein